MINREDYTFKGKVIFDYTEWEMERMAENNPADWENLEAVFDRYSKERKAQEEKELEAERRLYGGKTKEEYLNSMTLGEYKEYKENLKRAEREESNSKYWDNRWKEATEKHNTECEEAHWNSCEAIKMKFITEFPSKYGGTRKHRQLDQALLDEDKKLFCAKVHLVSYKEIDYMKTFTDDERLVLEPKLLKMESIELSDGSVFDFGVEYGKYGGETVVDWNNICNKCFTNTDRTTAICMSCYGTGANSKCKDGRRTINAEKRKRREMQQKSNYDWVKKCEIGRRIK